MVYEGRSIMREMKPSGRKSRERGSTLIVGIASLVFIIVPMSGLAIDVGIIYAVRSRLQASVDGAALAAARALVLGQTITSQESTAKQNAVNWFYANFPSGTWATYGTVMSTSNVAIDDTSVPNLAKIQITATTTVPTWFLKYLGFNFTNLGVIGQSSRRDVVAMMVLDRSGSMNSTVGACASLIAAGKIFTGQFAAGRDRVGLISFSDNVYIHSPPSTSFQTTLGYTNSSGPGGTGELDTITCAGGTSTPMAMSVGFNQLYQLNLPGAFNTLLLETDGLPNTLLQNSYNSALVGTNKTNLSNSSGCKDNNNKTVAAGGFNNAAAIPQWTPSNSTMLGSGSYAFPGAPGGTIPAGMVHEVYSADPSQNGGNHYLLLSFNGYYSNPTKYTNSVWVLSANAPGCALGASSQANGGQTVYSPYSGTDFAWFPSTDVFGNQLNPTNHSAFQTGITTSGGNITVNWTNYHDGALNATDDAAYNMRTNATIPTTVYAIGLGGNTSTGSDPPDFILLQRVANDPNADLYWSTPAESGPQYPACSTEPTCITYTNQPQGVFAFSYTQAELAAAFRSIASQVLRLSE
jgi:Flp pilus assembly protein TadG